MPQRACQVFDLLAQAGHIHVALAHAMERMVGFRHIAVHEDQKLRLPITVAIIREHLDEFLRYSRALIQRDEPAA
ncbi:MAG: HepT-like ribonuclease domain-containing protein [Aquincola tertiaricarbonis]